MTIARANRIAHWRKRRGLTQEALADVLGVHLMTISKLERGKIQLSATWLEMLSNALDVRVEDLMSVESAKYSVQVSGRIVNGVHVEDYPDGVHLHEVSSAAADDLTSDWLRVQGNHFEPFFYNNDLIRVTYYWPPEHRYLVGRMGNIVTTGGESLIAIAERHIAGKAFDLRTIKGSLLRDVEVEEFGLITAHLIDIPKELWPPKEASPITKKSPTMIGSRQITGHSSTPRKSAVKK
jgi:transcriptional regulator with XRE-family HTH domain